MNVVTCPPQFLNRTVAADLLADLLQNFDGPVEGNPCHYLGMGEVLRRPAYFPNALVRLAPDPRQVTENAAADRDRPVNRRQTVDMSMVQGIEDLAVDVELRLVDGRIPYAYRAGPFVTRQPLHLPLCQPALAAKPIHDLQLVGAARDSPQQPIPPCAGLVIKSPVHQGQQSEGGVAQPAIAVVPVARTADLLGQRGGRRRDNSAGRAKGQTLQRDQRAFDGIGPRTGRTAP